jgi:hypothetical protein
LVTWTVFAAGSGPPTGELKLSEELDNAISGGAGAVTLNVTLTTWGLLLAAAEVTATLAV